MSKQTMTKSQLREAINGLGPLAPDWLVEALEDFIELQEAHKNLLAIHAEDAYHLDEARAKLQAPANDEPCCNACALAHVTSQQLLSVPDEKSELAVNSAYAKGWNDCRAAMLKGEK